MVNMVNVFTDRHLSSIVSIQVIQSDESDNEA